VSGEDKKRGNDFDKFHGFLHVVAVDYETSPNLCEF